MDIAIMRSSAGNKKYVSGFWAATATLAGTIIGAGVFGLPFAAAQSGFFAAIIWLLVLAVAVALLHLMLAETILRTNGRHRLSGLAELYLGKGAARFVLVSELVGLTGSLLIYIVLGGLFISNIFGGIATPFWGSVAFWFLFSLPALFGLRLFAEVELLMSGALAVLFLGLSIFLFSDFSFSHIPWVTSKSIAQFFVPYGIILFALLGTNAIYSVRDMLGGREGRVFGAVAWGSIIPAAIYFLFSFSVLGVTGAATSEEAISGLGSVLGFPVVVAGSFVGLLALATSYMVIARYVVEELWFDVRLPRSFAFVMLLVPILLFGLGARNFIAIAGFVGTVVAAISGTIIVLTWWRAKTRGERRSEIHVPVPKVAAIAIVVMFLVAAILQVAFLL
ncbi:MAG: hypothetical protein A2806_04100 [Candidatus Terrybacteria bacterium RIFCSPHIGHO2_01_FULL_48_17]|uniref:Amino acid transporter transmembrane domain-containing protein n=1 Tax=Candidatus Terrybacteria bacterium RIFCSPHIGHO2_01_FULL_48_17 TaxID=1802362 RepID=A0A1G2PKK5_9BACT|nr:MAG: hypothetical protein A2806_04100 [Candidatus Terrybacteria bacterium RIFCSPHIGHO2_01_FULL_48_17]OHA53743.1 MAG: hypothetical protein A3A30_05235 [Candidatus Terrybacteria bacterium RIFCSPLOWO2_01_FULL_48_14]